MIPGQANFSNLCDWHQPSALPPKRSPRICANNKSGPWHSGWSNCSIFLHTSYATGKASTGTPNVPDFKVNVSSRVNACSLLCSNNTTVHSRGHRNWQIGSVFIAKLQTCRVRRPTNNHHQTARFRNAANHIQNSKSLYPGPRRLGLCPRPPSCTGKVKRWQHYSRNNYQRHSTVLTATEAACSCSATELCCA